VSRVKYGIAALENLLDYARILYFDVKSSKLFNYSTDGRVESAHVLQYMRSDHYQLDLMPGFRTPQASIWALKPMGYICILV
jgi:hypothetical protein